jgi:hypothetical protein
VADSDQIPARGELIEEGKRLRRIRERRGAGWCEEIKRGGSPFIG